MYRRFLLSFCALFLTGLLSTPRAHAQPCFDADVEYLGREFVTNIGGVNYYRWHYRASGESCINRGLSHWVLGICDVYFSHITEISDLSVDSSDPAGGDSTWYSSQIGLDPTTSVSGIKWNYLNGNQIDKLGEYDDFSFISPGNENFIQVVWSGKGGSIVEYGTTIGPSCDALPTQSTTWGGLKSRFR
jgi:hypothetical protein